MDWGSPPYYVERAQGGVDHTCLARDIKEKERAAEWT